MKYKFMLLSVLGAGFINAQSTLATTGFDAVSAGGSVSYSIGQIAYHSYSSSGFSVNEGVQQSYEISTLANNDISAVKEEIRLYPNPVQDLLFIDFGKDIPENSSYQLFDGQGKLAKQGILNQKKNNLDMSMLPQAAYIIRIIQKEKIIKTFKIIKK